MTDEPEVFAALAAWEKLRREGYSRLECMREALKAAKAAERMAAFIEASGEPAGRNDLAAKLEAARQLARELADEGGDVTEAELEELRKVWPPDRSIRPVIPETWTEGDG